MLRGNYKATGMVPVYVAPGSSPAFWFFILPNPARGKSQVKYRAEARRYTIKSAQHCASRACGGMGRLKLELHHDGRFVRLEIKMRGSLANRKTQLEI